MNLPKRGRGQRLFVEDFEDRFQRTSQFLLDTLSNFTGGKRGNAIMELGQLFQIDEGHDIGTNAKDLGEFDEARSKRRNARRQFSCTLTMDFIGQESRRPDKNPSAPISQKCEEKWSKPKPNDENSEDHWRQEPVRKMGS